jgi:hypothetical protein
MTTSVLYSTPAITIAILLFAGIIIFHIFGFKVNNYQKKTNPEFTTGGIGPLEGALLGLLSLLLAFTFNKAASNYDTRKSSLIQEANDIGTALMRCELYPDTIRNQFRKDFKEYIITRINYYKQELTKIKLRQK